MSTHKNPEYEMNWDLFGVPLKLNNMGNLPRMTHSQLSVHLDHPDMVSTIEFDVVLTGQGGCSTNMRAAVIGLVYTGKGNRPTERANITLWHGCHPKLGYFSKAFVDTDPMRPGKMGDPGSITFVPNLTRILEWRDMQVLAYLENNCFGVDLAGYDGIDLLELAARYGKIPLMIFLINKGVDVDSSTIVTPPLTIAASFGVLSSVKMLVEAGADVNRKSGALSETPVTAAKRGHYDEVVEYLLAHGAKDLDPPGSVDHDDGDS